MLPHRIPSWSTRALRGLLALFVFAVPAGPAAAADRAHQREQFLRALDAARSGRDVKTLAADLADYPLLPWIEQAVIARRLDKATSEDIAAFAQRWPGSLASQDLTEAWLLQLAQARRWKEYLADWHGSARRDLQCHALSARLAAGETLSWDADLAALWRSTTPLPSACDAPLAAARDAGLIDTAKVWERIAVGRTTGRAAIIDDLVSWLPAPQRPAAEHTAAALRDGVAAVKQAASWPDDAQHRTAAVLAMTRLARHDADDADAAWPGIEKHFHFSKEEKDRVAAAIALYHAANYDAGALTRLAAVPVAAQDDATREWRVRVAIAAGDWNVALIALDALTPEQQKDAEWRYLRARVLVKLGRKAEAEPIFAALAREPGYFSFLAADWLDQPYAICPLQLAADPDAERALLVDQAEVGRAFEWQALDRLGEARRAWDFIWPKLKPEQRRLAADLAYRRGWYDRAVFALTQPDEMKLYEQRFPLARETQVRRESGAADIDPAWTYAIIRAESAWVADARSGANAMGLMQLLPDTAARLAKMEKIPYSRPEDLFRPDTNIALGARYLARMAARYNGAPWLASAAYNAGSTPVERWLGQRGTLEPDFFVATIPYRETREYVAHVLAYSVIYDWRMNGKVVGIANRMPRYGQDYAPPSDDTARKSVACPALPTTTAAAAPAPPANGGSNASAGARGF